MGQDTQVNCQDCGQAATVHLTEIVNGKKKVKHFCAECADDLDELCPNCGGELVDRPTRAKRHHATNPPATERRFKPKV